MSSESPTEAYQVNQHNEDEDEIVIPGVDRSKLPEHVALRSENGGIVILIGTAHISDQSAADVRNAIRMLQPPNVLIELCPSRVAIINPARITRIYQENAARQEALAAGATTDATTAVHQRTTTQDVDAETKEGEKAHVAEKEHEGDADGGAETDSEDQSLWEALKGAMGKQGGLMAVAIGYMYKSISKQVNLQVGDDMRTAAEEAAKIGARIILGDRPIGITLARAWAGITTWQKLKLAFELLKVSFSSIKAEDLEQLKNKDILTELIQELGLHYPSLAVHLLHERDLYLAHKLRQCPGPITVGVIGLGHVEGIRRHWEDDIDITSLMVQPPTSSWRSFFLKVPLAIGLVGLSTLVMYKYLL